MAFTVVQKLADSHGAAGSFTTFSPGTGAAIGAGNTILAWVAAFHATDPGFSITDNVGGNTYTKVSGAVEQTSDTGWMAGFIGKNIQGGPTILTGNFASSTNPAMMWIEVSGLGASPTVESQAIVAQSGTTAPSSGVTGTLTTGDFLYAGCINTANANNITADTGAGWTSENNVVSSGTQFPIADEVINPYASPTGKAGTFTCSSINCVTGILAIKAAAAAIFSDSGGAFDAALSARNDGAEADETSLAVRSGNERRRTIWST